MTLCVDKARKDSYCQHMETKETVVVCFVTSWALAMICLALVTFVPPLGLEAYGTKDIEAACAQHEGVASFNPKPWPPYLNEAVAICRDGKVHAVKP